MSLSHIFSDSLADAFTRVYSPFNEDLTHTRQSAMQERNFRQIGKLRSENVEHPPTYTVNVVAPPLMSYPIKIKNMTY